VTSYEWRLVLMMSFDQFRHVGSNRSMAT